MIALALVLVIVILAALLAEVITNHYRQLWREASALLTVSDERNEELRQRVDKYASAVAKKTEEVRKLKQANGQLGTQLVELGEEFRGLHELGVELQKPIRQALEVERRNAHAAAVAEANRRADEAHEQIMRQIAAPAPAPKQSRIETYLRLMGGGH